jgi:UDP-N-acetylmuramoyl-tripeptide--D-alanyl-D-alanine ligase
MIILARLRWYLRRCAFSRRARVVYGSLGTGNGRTRLLLSAFALVQPVCWVAADLHRRTLARRARVVAIVGSFGKTTTTCAVRAALGLPPSRLAGMNAGAGLVVAVLGLRPGSGRGVIEVGIGRRGRMAGYARLIRPDIVVVTSIGTEHLSSLGTLEVTREEKAEMLRALPSTGIAVLNGDDPNVLWMKRRAPARVITFGFGEANEVRASGVTSDGPNGTRFRLHVDGEAHDLHTRLIGRHLVYPILAAVAVCRAEGLGIRQIVPALEALEPTRNRLQPIRHPSGAILLLDAYKAHLETIYAALDTLDDLPAKRKIVVLGDVEEPPGSQGPIYRELGKRLAEIATRVVFVGGKTNFNRLKVGTKAGGLSRDALTNVRTGALEVAEVLKADLRPGDLVLVKGRSTQHLERAVLRLMGMDVGCRDRLCRRRHDCETCPFLAHGV